MSVETKRQRRPGAGPPHLFPGQDVERLNITLPTASVAALRQIGQGSISRGIQVVLERAMTNRDQGIETKERTR